MILNLVKWNNSNSTLCGLIRNLFPFHQFDDDEFIYLNSKLNISKRIFNVNNRCSNLTLQSFDRTELSENDWETDVDPDSNFFNDYNFECKYYTDSKFQAESRNIDGFTIIYFNARSLKTNFKYIESYIAELGKDFHVIAITESWLEVSSNLNDYALSNYEMYNVFRPDQRGGGVALISVKN